MIFKGVVLMAKFPCLKCGTCCTKLDNNKIYSHLDQGNGVCIYFDSASKLCSIYDDRPLICNVEKMYDAHFFKIMSYDEYLKINKEACEILRKED